MLSHQIEQTSLFWVNRFIFKVHSFGSLVATIMVISMLPWESYSLCLLRTSQVAHTVHLYGINP